MNWEWNVETGKISGPMKSLLIIAESRSPENRELLVSILKNCPGWNVRRYDTIDQALAADAADADIILVLQSRPWEFSDEAVGRLYQAFPLARVVVGLGPWCGSALRRERTWPASATIVAAGVVDRLLREMGEFESGISGLPRTASVEERVLRDPPCEKLPPGMKVAISSPDRAVREWLCELVGEAGGVSTPNDSFDSAALICDIDPWEKLQTEEMKRLWKVYRGRPLVALTELPTVSLVNELAGRGASCVLSKPCDGLFVIQALLAYCPPVASGNAADLIAFPRS